MPVMFALSSASDPVSVFARAAEMPFRFLFFEEKDF
jgi:hypothetical protein